MDKSPLRKLSPELRNAIYELVFADAPVFLDSFDKGPAALLQTCREIRSEARLLCFAKAAIRLDRNKIKQLNNLSSEYVGRMVFCVYGSKALREISIGRIGVTVRTGNIVQKPQKFLHVDCLNCYPKTHDNISISAADGSDPRKKKNHRHRTCYLVQ